MELVHYDNLLGNDTATLKEQIRRLLIAEDESFVPPLSARASTTQIHLSEPTGNRSIDDYLEAMAAQSIIVLKERDHVAGFLSYRREFNCPDAGADKCAYVSTVLIDPRYRGQRLTYDLYYELFSRMRKTGMPIVTRTWSTNGSHLHILDQLGFKLVKRIGDDRGEGIDTVYYRKDFNPKHYTPYQKIKAYGLGSTLLASIILYAATIATAIFYVVFRGQGEIVPELLLAFTTSLLVSAVCLNVDLISQYRSKEHDGFLRDMSEMGIKELNLDKQALLMEKVAASQSLIWLSGYKHILTSSIVWGLQRAAKRGVRIRFLISPPWLSGFQAVYGEGAKVVYNYIKVARSIVATLSEDESADSDLSAFEARFTSKVLFSDTYRVDDCYITSPYSHETGLVKTARDFFTWTVENNSAPYELIQAEYQMLWDTAEEYLDLEEFSKVFPDDRTARSFPTVDDCLTAFRSCVKRRSDDSR